MVDDGEGEGDGDGESMLAPHVTACASLGLLFSAHRGLHVVLSLTM